MQIEVISPEPANASVDIVLVHGWCREEPPWTHGSGEDAICWPKSILPTLLPQARIILFSYDYKLEEFWATNSENEIDTHAHKLIASITSLRIASKTEDRPLILVAHSIGGLVCERALVRASNGPVSQKEFCKHVHRLALIGTPFHKDKQGWAETGDKFFQLSGMNADVSLQNDLDKSKELAEIGEKFMTFIKSRTPGSFEVACFYESVPTVLSGLGENKVLITDKASVQIPDCPEPFRLKTTHQSMVEVASENDAHFQLFWEELDGWVKVIATTEEDDKERAQFNITFSGENRGLQVGQNKGKIEGSHIRNK